MGCIGSKEKPATGGNQNQKATKLAFSIRLLGDIAVGKSSLLLSWTDGKFSGEAVATVGDEEHRSKDISVNNEQITLDVWDSGGSERYSVITSSQFRRVSGFLYCFDLSRADTFKNVVRWLEQVEQYCDTKSPAQILVGLKSDQNRDVSVEDANAFAALRNMKYIEVSSKTSSNVDLVFATMAQAVVENAEKAQEDE